MCSPRNSDLAMCRTVASGRTIETRGYIGDWDPETGKFTLHATAWVSPTVRNTLAKFCFFCEPENIRVVVPRLGGGFGAKNIVYGEEILVLWAARKIGAPVRWISDRTGSFISDVHTSGDWFRLLNTLSTKTTAFWRCASA